MTVRSLLARVTQHEAVNFALTNRLPRRFATTVVGRISKSQNPLVKGTAMRLWQLFTDLDLREAKKERFDSLHDCFTRELKDGARPVDRRAGILTSPCDGIVVSAGPVLQGELLQVKGSRYTLEALMQDERLPARFANGTYATLRLTSAMYHRFHAPLDGVVRSVRYIPGDVWNVNPVALKRVERLYCRNERAVIDMEIAGGEIAGGEVAGGGHIALVPVAAILVAGLKLRFLDLPRSASATDHTCAATLAKGDEMGWFEHGSTIIVLAEAGWDLAPGVSEGRLMRMGQPLMQAKS